jgi:hypothetical protein
MTNKPCTDCEPLNGGSVVTITEAQQPYCEQCGDDATCNEKLDAKCVIYNSDNCNGVSELENIGAASCDNLETILEKIDDLIGNNSNISITPTNTPSIDITANGPANHNIKADVIISPDAGNITTIRGNGVYTPNLNNGKVKVDADDAPAYLETQILGDSNDCVSVSVQKRDGILYIKPTINFDCFLQKLQTDHYDTFCALIQGCNCFLTIQNLIFTLDQACPDGYDLVGGVCQQVETQAATPGGQEYTLQTVTNNVWSKGGALIFKNGFNLNGSGPGATFASDIGSGNVVQTYTPNVWLNGTTTPFGGGESVNLGPMNRTAVWSDPYNADTTFIIPIVVPTSKTYYVGIGVDNVGSITVTSPNGNVTTLLDQNTAGASAYYTGSSTWNFDFWNIYPVFLTAGQNFITVNGHDTGIAFGFGIEIYDATVAQLQAAALDAGYLSDPPAYDLTFNTYSNLDLIFSSRCARQGGSITANSASCPDSTWTLDVTTGSTPTSPCQGINNPVSNWTCRKVITTAFEGYVVHLQWDRIAAALDYTIEQKLHDDPETSYSLTVGSPLDNPSSGPVTLTVSNLPSNSMDFRVRANFADCSTEWTSVHATT